ncbi:hypothetical protein L211DRAFT_852672 [Terfezia boudieri ATCC MYA-4762]|uniref:Uncharacterized protein n=1 Tax=Terfezia boudieri ATCC MYA-4762 TaxID=1051890 RepID=A0A3N4LF07_9PEZI|nr:hypothetical protein L211DRAFT_852672 [Terfezia boudieri ATCC MYA-4762]
MMMSAQIVEVIQKDNETELRQARIGAYVNGLSEKNKGYLISTVDKRMRSERDGSDSGDVLGQELEVLAGQRMQREGLTYPIPTRQEGVNQAEQHPIFVQDTIPVPRPPMPQAEIPSHLMHQPPILPQGRLFVPDPGYNVPARPPFLIFAIYGVKEKEEKREIKRPVYEP